MNITLYTKYTVYRRKEKRKKKRTKKPGDRHGRSSTKKKWPVHEKEPRQKTNSKENDISNVPLSERKSLKEQR